MKTSFFAIMQRPFHALFRRRVGRDDSFIEFGIVGIPRWLFLILAYLVVIFVAALALPPWIGEHVANRLAGVGPALLGIVDAWRRLRTVQYVTRSALGLEITHNSSVIDRLTMRECGWYLPVLAIPLPVWLIGLVASVEIVQIWGW
jgi:hypothetical protein